MKIHIVLTGRDYHLADKLPGELQLPETAGVTDAIAKIRDELTDAKLPDSCLVSVGNTHLGTVADHLDRPLRDGDELMLIAPVAGG